MKNTPNYLTDLRILLDAYGEPVVAKLLGITVRGMQNWTSDNPKAPRDETQRKISELVLKHQSGEDLRTRQNEGLKDELLSAYKDQIASQKDQIKVLQDQVNLATGELRHIAVMNFAMLKTLRKSVAQILAKTEKVDLLQIAQKIDKETAAFYRSVRERGSLIDLDI